MPTFGERIGAVARDERVAQAAGFGWGFAEGVFFFIVPDVYVTFAGLYALRAGAIAWAASIAGSLVAVCVIYLLVVVLGLDYRSFLERIPGISVGMTRSVDAMLSVEGLPYTPWLVTGGIPLKVYAGVAAANGTGLGALFVWTLFARVVRIAPSFGVVAGARLLLRRSIDVRPGLWFALWAVVWIVFYAFYFAAMSRRTWL